MAVKPEVKKPTELEKLEAKLKQYTDAKRQYEALVLINDGAAQAIQNLITELKNKKDDYLADSDNGCRRKER